MRSLESASKLTPPSGDPLISVLVPSLDTCEQPNPHVHVSLCPIYDLITVLILTVLFLSLIFNSTLLSLAPRRLSLPRPYSCSLLCVFIFNIVFFNFNVIFTVLYCLYDFVATTTKKHFKTKS